MYNFIAVAMAATAVTALPAGAPQQPSPGQFVTAMTVLDGILISVNAVKNGTSEDLVLVGERLSAYPGTPAYIQRNLEDPAESLSFDISGERYGWKIHDVGHVDGAVFPVTASKDYSEFKFSTASDEITHKITATSNQFFACDAIVNGKPATVLSWGNQKFIGGPLEGCNSTRVYKSPDTN